MHSVEERPHGEGQLQVGAEGAELLYACCEQWCQSWSC